MKNAGLLIHVVCVMLCMPIGNAQDTQNTQGFYPVIGLNTGTTIIGAASGITFGADFSAVPDGFFLHTQFNFTKPFPRFLMNNVHYMALNMRTAGMQIGTSIHTKNFIYAVGTGFRCFDASHFQPLQANPDLRWTHISGITIPLTLQIYRTGERSGIRLSYTIAYKDGVCIHEGLISFVACVGS